MRIISETDKMLFWSRDFIIQWSSGRYFSKISESELEKDKVLI